MGSLLNNDCIHVVVGIIKNSQSEVLVSRRNHTAHLGGLLEFPGGKVEQNESPFKALRRELFEELNITAKSFSPLILIPYDYKDRKIVLDVYNVDEYSGYVHNNEKQLLSWKKITELEEKDFPPANHGVLQALHLPKIMAVTPDFSQDSKFLIHFEKTIQKEFVEIIQLRSHDLSSEEYTTLWEKCFELCCKNNVQLIMNRDDKDCDDLKRPGLHLSSKKLLTSKHRPADEKYIIGASCHNFAEIERANKLKLDYVFIGPVIEKNSSENSKTLSWEGFAELCRHSQVPAYAIGGLGLKDIDKSIRYGGQGIAAIRAVWG